MVAGTKVCTAAMAAGVIFASVGCGDFETPSIVLDMRVLSVTAEPPEVVAEFDPDNPDDVDLVDVTVCALVADPTRNRRLTYTMGACAPTDNGRCDEVDLPFVPMDGGTVEDPELSDAPVRLCSVLRPSILLADVIEEAVSDPAVVGFGGVLVQVEINVREQGMPPADGLFARKGVLYSPRVPDERVANTNPTLEAIEVERAGGDPFALPIGRCRDITPPAVAIDDEVTLTPIEPAGVREDYVVPTFDGGVRMFTENLSYAWFSTAGDWSRETTGGPKDFVGNEPPLDTTWTAEFPADDAPTEPVEVPLWITQRDERGGIAWYQSCVQVVP